MPEGEPAGILDSNEQLTASRLADCESLCTSRLQQQAKSKPGLTGSHLSVTEYWAYERSHTIWIPDYTLVYD